MQLKPPSEKPSDADATSGDTPPTIVRISSEELFRQGREIEIEHHGKIYRLRVTQLNKLILTA